MSDDKPNGGFIQFPLCALSMGGEFAEILVHCFGYAACLLCESLPEDQYDDDDAKLDHVRRTIGFGNSHLRALRASAQKIKAHVSYAASLGQKTATVRLPTVYIFEIMQGDWPENEARVYIAIASAIGAKTHVRLGWEAIRSRAAGFLESDQMQRGSLTRNQVDYAAAQLTARGLLAGFTYGRAVRYWSFPAKFSREEMARVVVARQLKKKGALGESDEDLAARLTRELKAAPK